MWKKLPNNTDFHEIVKLFPGPVNQTEPVKDPGSDSHGHETDSQVRRELVRDFDVLTLTRLSVTLRYT